MAENKKAASSEKEESKSKWIKIWEGAQTAGIIFSIVFLRSRNTPSPDSEAARSVPDWVIHMFPNFTKEDEVEFTQMRGACPDDAIWEVEADFRQNLVKEGTYDETEYRLMLVALWREHGDLSQKATSENKASGRFDVEKTKVRNMCTEFFNALITARDSGGNEQEIFEKQKKIALDRMLLVKRSFFRRVRDHKLLALGIILLILGAAFCGVVNILMNIFYAIFG